MSTETKSIKLPKLTPEAREWVRWLLKEAGPWATAVIVMALFAWHRVQQEDRVIELERAELEERKLEREEHREDRQAMREATLQMAATTEAILQHGQTN